jgi:DNA-binding transcriptional regulator YdaS (Cro superfamily)
MAVAFDSLGYARHLRERGVPQEQAEAMADAARTYIMGELVTREELRQALDTQTLRLTVRLGLMLAAAVGILGTMQALLAP